MTLPGMAQHSIRPDPAEMETSNGDPVQKTLVREFSSNIVPARSRRGLPLEADQVAPPGERSSRSSNLSLNEKTVSAAPRSSRSITMSFSAVEANERDEIEVDEFATYSSLLMSNLKPEDPLEVTTPLDGDTLSLLDQIPKALESFVRSFLPNSFFQMVKTDESTMDFEIVEEAGDKSGLFFLQFRRCDVLDSLMGDLIADTSSTDATGTEQQQQQQFYRQSARFSMDPLGSATTNPVSNTSSVYPGRRRSIRGRTQSSLGQPQGEPKQKWNESTILSDPSRAWAVSVFVSFSRNEMQLLVTRRHGKNLESRVSPPVPFLVISEVASNDAYAKMEDHFSYCPTNKTTQFPVDMGVNDVGLVPPTIYNVERTQDVVQDLDQMDVIPFASSDDPSKTSSLTNSNITSFVSGEALSMLRFCVNSYIINTPSKDRFKRRGVEVQSFLGSGSTATVCEGILVMQPSTISKRQTSGDFKKRRVACKSVTSSRTLFERETSFLRLLRDCDGISSLVMAFEDTKTIVTEPVGTPLHRIRVNEIRERGAGVVFIPVIRGLQMMRKRGIVHRDVSPGNMILVPTDTSDEMKSEDNSNTSSSHQLVLIDLGMAQKYSARAKAYSGARSFASDRICAILWREGDNKWTDRAISFDFEDDLESLVKSAIWALDPAARRLVNEIAGSKHLNPKQVHDMWQRVWTETWLGTRALQFLKDTVRAPDTSLITGKRLSSLSRVESSNQQQTSPLGSQDDASSRISNLSSKTLPLRRYSVDEPHRSHRLTINSPAPTPNPSGGEVGGRPRLASGRPFAVSFGDVEEHQYASGIGGSDMSMEMFNQIYDKLCDWLMEMSRYNYSA